MRVLAWSLAVAGCANPSSSPTSPVPDPVIAPVALACPPLGTWTLALTTTCPPTSGRFVFSVHAGPPPPADPAPMFDVPSPVVASGRTDERRGYERLLRVTDPHTTAAGCEMTVHVEYVGPHEAIRDEARVTLAGGRVHGTGTHVFFVDDCRAEDPDACECEAAVTIDGAIS